MGALRALIRDWFPPAVIRWLIRVRGGGIRFEGKFATWEDASVHCTGYDAQVILDKVLAATLKVKRGEAMFERDSVLFDKIDYSWPVLSGLLWVAAQHGGSLNVLDFGGALGSGYFQNRKFLQALPSIRWSVVEQEHYVAAGREYIQDEVLRFYRSVEECLFENSPNVVLLSSVLQYVPQPYDVIDSIMAAGPQVIIFDRTSFLNEHAEAYITIQQVPDSIYRASYPCHFFVEETICNYLTSKGYELHEVFESGDKLSITANWKGHFFTKSAHNRWIGQQAPSSTQKVVLDSRLKVNDKQPAINSLKS